MPTLALEPWQRIGALASLVAAGVGAATVGIIVTAVGSAAVDPAAAVAMARINPAPLVTLEVLRIAGAACIPPLVEVFRRRLSAAGASNVRVAAILGFVASMLLTIAGLLALFAIVQQSRVGGAEANTEIGVNASYLGLFGLLARGGWLILTSGSALRTGALPKGLATYGYVLGAVELIAFLLPPLALLALVLGIVWSVWVGAYLLRRM